MAGDRPPGRPCSYVLLSARAHRLSRLACRRAPAARVLARRFAMTGERSARSPVGSPVTAGALGLAAGAASRALGAWPCLAALTAASRSARSSAADWRAKAATRRLTRDKASSNASAFNAARVFSGRARPRPPCSATAALAARRYWPTYLFLARLIRASSAMAASSSSAASSARPVWSTSNRSASLRTASNDLFISASIPGWQARLDQSSRTAARPNLQDLPSTKQPRSLSPLSLPKNWPQQALQPHRVGLPKSA